MNLDWYKETLRRKKIRIERKDLSDLVKKYVPIHQRVEASEQAMFEKEETEPTSEEEWRMRDKLPLYRLAVLAKIASFMRELHLDLDDFAVVLTRHKESMARYSAIEGELYRERGRIKNTIEGKPPNVKYELIEEFCRADPLKILAENLVETQVDISEFEKLKDRFWVRIEFGKDYEKFLSYYRSEMRREKKRKKKIVADAMRAKEKRAKSAAVKERHANLGEDRE